MNAKNVAKGVLPFVIVAGGVGLVAALIASRSEPPREPPTDEGLLVETLALHEGPHEVVVRAHGQVVPARRVVIGAEVPGRVRSVSEEFVPGGRYASGEVMLRLDPRDYALAVQSRQADVNRASLELQVETRRQEVAQREWESFGGGDESPSSGSSVEGTSLALREPQRESAEVGVTAARSSAQQARLNLQRATVRAPFNAMVLAQQAEVGQYVGPGSPLVTLVGTDTFWVQVSLPVSALDRIRIADEGGSSARVWMEVDGKKVEREGSVVRLLPDLDPAGSMARVLVEVVDPLRLSEDGAGEVPMLLGSYVTVDIAALPIDAAIELPRAAVREGNRVFVMTPEDTLALREVEVVWGRDNTVLVQDGVSDGERLVTSRVPAPVEGMKLRERAPPSATEAPRAEAPRAEP